MNCVNIMKRKNLKWYLVFGTWCLVLGLMGCAQEALYNNLTQEDANRVMVLLEQHGINAKLDKEVVQNETFWTIKVGKEEIAKARELVVTSHVISPKAPGLKEVYQGKGASGWIKTPAEERARYLLALKGEIVNSLKKLPDVVDVDVVLNIPEEEELGLREKKHPTASVVLKAMTPSPGQNSLNQLQIQEFVANSVEGMSPRDVSVLLNFMAPMGTTLRPGETILLPKGLASAFPEGGSQGATEASVRLMGLKLDPASKERLKVYLIIFFLVLVLLSSALIVSIIQSSRTREELKAMKSEGAVALPGRTMEEGGPPRLGAPEGGEEEEEEIPHE